MKLPDAFNTEKNTINAVIETPKGSRNKYAYDKESDYFKLKKILPSGTVFPLDFGFIPHTIGGDGDPMDVLIIMEQPTYPGCVIECRVIGVIKAVQTEGKKQLRNDRIVAVAESSLDFEDLKSISDMNKNLLDDIIHFFEYYNSMEGRKFKLKETKGLQKAMELIRMHLIK